MTGPFDAQRLAELVRDVPDFPTPGIVFKDIAPLLADHATFAGAVEALASHAGGPGAVDVVLGIEARGFILGAPVAYHLGAGFVPARKPGKLPGATTSVSYALEYGEASLELQHDAFPAGSRVLIVDDVLATGGTAAAAIELVGTLGGRVVGLAFLLELAALGGAGQLAGYDRHALLRV